MFATTNAIAKIAAVVAGLGLVAMSFAFAPSAKAATTEELQAQINALLAQISALQGTTASASMTFTMDLTLGSSGSEVTALQNWLISKGYSIPAGATGYFGAQTQAALAAYQAANGISPAAGYFGPITRAKVNAAGGSTGSTGGNTGSTGGLQGNAGSIEDAQLLSSLNNEEVGEDEEDVEVYGLNVEADDGSDIELTAVRLVFLQGTAPATRDFDRYASEVSIWLDGEEVARLDADEFNDNNDYSKTVSLDSGAVIDAGEDADLTVAVSGISNLDSADETDTWTVEVNSIRFEDADGAVISDDSTGDIGDTRTFSFDSFANSSDAELKVSLTDSEDADDINNAHVLDIDDTDDTDDVEVLAFTLEAEGDSDLEIDEIPVLFTSTETTGNDPDDLVSSATLWMDGEEIASENFLTSDADGSTETITFEDLGLTIDAGDEVDFMVTVDAVSTADALDAGDTLKAEIGSTERGNIDVQDQSGEDLASGDRTGTALGEASVFYDAGIMVTFKSSSEEETFTADDAAESDQGQFKITFDVAAFDGDFRIDRSCEEGGADAAGQGVEYTITNSGSNTTTCVVTSTTSDTEDTANTFEIDEDKTRTFTLTVDATATSTAFAEVSLESINWGTATNDTNASYYTFNLDDYKTDALNLADL